MFHDVGHARAVARRRAETDAEYLVIVVFLYQKNPCSALLMPEQIPLCLDSVQFLFFYHLVCLQVSDTHLLFLFSFHSCYYTFYPIFPYSTREFTKTYLTDQRKDVCCP